MKRIFKYLIAAVSMVALATSCINSNLEDLPVYDESNIVQVNAEWRYNFGTEWTGEPAVKFQQLNRIEQKIDTVACTAVTKFSLPAANVTQGWTDAERAKVVVTNLAVKLNLSTAARVKPIGDSPALGVPADWSKSHQYEVWSASGKTKIWTVTVQGIVR